MRTLFMVWSVALAESRILLRSILYKIFLVFILLIGLLVFKLTHNLHSFTAIPAGFPYKLLWMLSPFFAAFALFAAEESIARERSEDSTPMLFARPVGNVEYMLGKALGVWLALMGAVGLFLVLIAVFGFVFAGVSPTFAGYVLIPLLMCGTSFAVLIGLAYAVAAVVGSRAARLGILLAVFWGVTFHVGSSFHAMFDYAGYHVPLLYSDFTGFGDIAEIVTHRAMWFLAGLALVLFAVQGLRRIPNSRKERVWALAFAFMCLAGAMTLGYARLSDISRGQTVRNGMNTLSREVASMPRVSVTDCAIDLRHRGRTIEADAALRFENRTDGPIASYNFSLNPGLKVTSVTRGGSNVPFERKRHMVVVTPESPLPPSASDSLTIRYRGRIDEDACYADIDVDGREKKEATMGQAARRFAFITPRYVLLTPECLWYPASGAPYGSVFPGSLARDFVRFTLRVETNPRLTAISQGAVETTGAGVWTFVPEQPLPRISLAVGDYEKKAVIVDEVEYAVYVKRGHDYFSKTLAALRGKLPKYIREYREYYEGEIGRSYPFKRYAIIEVPAHFSCYRHSSSPYMEAVQPEMDFLHEMGGGGMNSMSTDFKRTKREKEKNARVTNRILTNEEIADLCLKPFVFRELFNRFPYSSFVNVYTREVLKPKWSMFSSEMKASYNTNIFPNFHMFTNSVASGTDPLLDTAIDLYFYSKAPFINNVDTKFEQLGALMGGKSPGEALADPRLRVCGPEILGCASEVLFYRLGSEVGERKLDAFLTDFLDRHRGRSVPADSLYAAYRAKFGSGMEGPVRDMLSGSGLPACIISDARVYEVPGTDGAWFNVRFTAHNPNEATGTFAATVQLKDDERGDDFRQPPSFTRYFTLPGGTAKEVGFIVDQTFYSWMWIRTLLSENRPNDYTVVIRPAQTGPDYQPLEGARTLDAPPAYAGPGEVIVDNDDPGFEIVSGAKRGLLVRLLRPGGEHHNEITEWSWWVRPPRDWRVVVDGRFYGLVRKTGQVIKAGKGDRRIRWTAEIPESGKYDVYFYTPDAKKEFMMPYGRVFAKDFHFFIRTAGGMEERTVDMQETNEGWMPLGTHEFAAGSAVVELTDATKGEGVYADAVKWVKR